MDFLGNPNGGLNLQVLDTTAAWANSAVINTAVSLDVTLPSLLNKDGLYVVTITNPSASDLTVIVKNKETFGGVARYPEVTRWGVLANTTDGLSRIVQGWMIGEAGRITITNDTAIGGAGAFTAYVRVRAV